MNDIPNRTEIRPNISLEVQGTVPTRIPFDSLFKSILTSSHTSPNGGRKQPSFPSGIDSPISTVLLLENPNPKSISFHVESPIEFS